MSGALTLALLTFALTQASSLGWESPIIIATALLCLVCGAVFVIWEARNPEAMLPLTLFRDSTVCSATVIGLIVNLVFYGMVFAFSLYFQSIRHFTPEQTGLAFLPMMTVLMLMNIIAGRLLTRLGSRALTTLGLLMSAMGYGLSVPALATQAYGWLALPMLLAGAGIALAIPTITNATLTTVAIAQAGIASGLLNSARQVGGVMGVAVFGFLVRSSEPGRFMAGMDQALMVSCGVLVLGAAVGFVGFAPQPTACALAGDSMVRRNRF